MQRAAHKTYLALTEAARTDAVARTADTGAASTRIAALGTSFCDNLQARLTDVERQTFSSAIARMPGGAPLNLHDLLTGSPSMR